MQNKSSRYTVFVDLVHFALFIQFHYLGGGELLKIKK